MSRSLRTELSRFGQTDLAVRVVGGLLGVLPFAPSWRPVPDLDARAAALDPALGARIAARAEALALSPGPQSALTTFDFLDKGDSGIALFSGVRGAVKVMQGQGAAAFEMDPQQAADAGLKAVGLAWVVWKLFEGLPPGGASRAPLDNASGGASRAPLDNASGGASRAPQDNASGGASRAPLDNASGGVAGGPPPAPGSTRIGAADRLKAFTQLESGRALLAWYVSAELVLPFADNIAQGGTDAMIDMLDSQAAEHAQRLSAVAGTEVVEAAGMLHQMTGTLRSALGQAAVYSGPVLEWSKANLPGLLGAVDRATGLLATGVDTLATYRCIGASLVADVCLAQAAAEVHAEVELERRDAETKRERAAAEAEAARIAAERAEAARAEAERNAAQARRIASAQQEKYTLEEAVPAASLAASPIKVTRSAEMTPAQAALPAKSGCFGCGGVVLFAVLAAGAMVPFLT